MKIILTLFFLALSAFPAFAGEKESAYDRVMRTGTIRCGYGISPPVLMKDINTGEFSGMDYEVWEAVARELDIKIEWIESSGWSTFPEDLRQGKYDAYCSTIWMTPARTKFLSATIPVTYNILNAYVRPDDNRFKNPDDFNSETVTAPVVEGDITEHMVKSRFENTKLYALPSNSNWGDLYLSVITKKADVFFADSASFESISSSNTVKLKKLDFPPIYTFGARYSMASGEVVFRDMVDVVLQSMIDDGRLAKMAAKTSPHIIVPDKNFTKDTNK